MHRTKVIHIAVKPFFHDILKTKMAIRFPIDEIRRYISALYKRKSRYKRLETKYNSIVKHILDNTEHLKKTTWA